MINRTLHRVTWGLGVVTTNHMIPLHHENMHQSAMRARYRMAWARRGVGGRVSQQPLCALIRTSAFELFVLCEKRHEAVVAFFFAFSSFFWAFSTAFSTFFFAFSSFFWAFTTAFSSSLLFYLSSLVFSSPLIFLGGVWPPFHRLSVGPFL